MFLHTGILATESLLRCARGQLIRLVFHSELSGPGPCGVWIGRHADDIIVYGDITSGHYMEQILLHELRHRLLKQYSGSHSNEILLIQELVPDIDPTTVIHVLNGPSYDTEQKSQAELFCISDHVGVT
ncbi:hypothetical protein MUBE_13235 [Mycobacterium uberis]|uniref:Uncharacterized protein n=1 Tax=Mycobacterium uberis TaxID=2162698 RepID=A0A3E1HDT4_9MYCO|nr:hypothetical protein [Mycobacterium uberis]RFD24631.1 hypothetical protein MUBE_13235 [Mycobacterium uberis]